jgi:hypothetical protein
MENKHESMDINSYITGFTDGEGCFQISFSLRKKMRLGIEVRPSFSISQHKRNKEIILFLHRYFNCGGVRFSKRDQNYKFEVRSTKDLVQIIIPHFDKFPLLTSKKEEFERFKEICKIIHSNHHLTKEGMNTVIQLSRYVNAAGNKKYNRNDLLKMAAR